MKIADFLFKSTGVHRFEAYLDVSSFRHKLISSNVANVSTPGYGARDIDFQAEYTRLTGETGRVAGELTHPAHLPLGAHRDREPDIEETRPKPDELNAVDIDREVSQMAQNELQFTVAARLLQKKFEGLRRAIAGR
ncbi:MAG TPA: flagellar basal body rod protein FlgB [candidate division Zixibacteria bacterium]|nr:flagellar basal body rod protein FlgB [candidate division Zixibacteria bacterium]MDD4917135.1 flagellar basal body rod protein FlgB [candidate division Zixibacteria bacterium]MDM7972681.1 flagellar basal body rod protein FlgB [candidate division Zixibacteria bacterium]HOD65403.1 flagellar basal body rod protein FlgB [candidate division Zixibacteria bacterium]HOZ07529.1 flagellar basal body rod protein FlgB [candidate division Zixibacteria bacterium]